MTYYALLLFFLVEYVRPGNFIPGLDALKLNLLVPVWAIIGTFLRKSPVSNRDLFAEPNTIAMILFLILLCVSTLMAVVTMYAFDVTKNVFAYMLIYTVLVRQLGSLDRIKGVFMTLIGVHVLAIGLSPDIFADSSGRASVSAGAFLGDGNDFSLSVNIILPMCLFLLQESRKTLPKFLWLGVTLLLVMAIVATKSRGGTIALVIVGLYFWTKSRRKLATAAWVLAVASVVVIAAPPAYLQPDVDHGRHRGELGAGPHRRLEDRSQHGRRKPDLRRGCRALPRCPRRQKRRPVDHGALHLLPAAGRAGAPRHRCPAVPHLLQPRRQPAIATPSETARSRPIADRGQSAGMHERINRGVRRRRSVSERGVSTPICT